MASMSRRLAPPQDFRTSHSFHVTNRMHVLGSAPPKPAAIVPQSEDAPSPADADIAPEATTGPRGAAGRVSGDDPDALPLDGIRVLELGHIMAAPFCGLLLADMGADVVKVEPPVAGDAMRRMGPPFFNGEAGAFLIMNRNKRSIVLNLKSQAGRDLFRRLVMQADVLVENYRPGALERMGLGYEELASLNPSLIYCSISGFGRTGPYAGRAGFAARR